MIAYFFPSVNTYSPEFPSAHFRRVNITNCITASWPSFQTRRFCLLFEPRREVKRKASKILSAICTEIFPNFVKNSFLLDFFQFSPFFYIYIRYLIIFFYKELSTLSTEFSTIIFLFISNYFIAFFHFITVPEVEFTPPSKIRFIFT